MLLSLGLFATGECGITVYVQHCVMYARPSVHYKSSWFNNIENSLRMRRMAVYA
jgi:hypothetical protein